MNLLNFSEANCRNCYKCLRTCSVKAVKIKNDQAGIVEERCIGCGQCLIVCPQNARNIQSDLQLVRNAIKENKKVIASIAPSFVGAFSFDEAQKMAVVLKTLGFQKAEETAGGADVVAELYKSAVESGKQESMITSCCPSANYLVEKYFPSLTKFLIPVVSPMLAHGKLLKKKYGYDSMVVFIGPCAAKKIEAVSFQHKETIDAVLTFEELSKWINDEGIDIDELTPQDFDGNASSRGAAFPIIGGVLKSFDADGSEKNYELLKVDGINECMEIFKAMEEGRVKGVCVEVNICRGGCLNGPGMPKNADSFFVRQKKVKEYLTKRKSQIVKSECEIPKNVDFSKVFVPRPIVRESIDPAAIKHILESMGKFEPGDELNCGGCGYNTCREKAQAVLEGMAEMNMCLPFMRGKAESVTNVIFENTPNIIMLIDEELKVKEINPTAEKLFGIKADYLKERPISIIMDDEHFRRVRDTKKPLLGQKVFYKNYGIVLQQNILYLEKQSMLLAIMSNNTMEEKQREELKRVKENALDAAQRVIEKQMRVAQEIASLLGETTAETKVTLTKLKEIAIQETGE
ncbi:MAG: 4Fe-4S dicluster protein [Clostridia bacterium]|jgi:iron only hydrogenase large subunit-like protein/uncharacterized Fe-S cluster-containing protein|nr:4Fe-4S dicluster protein [Clostridia bacterium]